MYKDDSVPESELLTLDVSELLSEDADTSKPVTSDDVKPKSPSEPDEESGTPGLRSKGAWSRKPLRSELESEPELSSKVPCLHACLQARLLSQAR